MDAAWSGLIMRAQFVLVEPRPACSTHHNMDAMEYTPGKLKIRLRTYSFLMAKGLR